MKKSLSMLAVFGIISSTTVTVVACGTKTENKNSENKPEQPKEDLNQIIKDYQDEVTNIYIDHIKKEVMQNLIGVQESEKKHLFIKKDKIKDFTNKEKELTLKDKKDIENDENLILNSTLLAQKLNELKKVNKYKVILDDIDSIFDGVEIIYNDNLKIKSGELSQGVYIGNFINEYKINIRYKGKNSIEKFEIKDILKYTSTDSEAFKLAADNLAKNMEKDFLVSSEMKKYSNFEWNNIKGNKQSYEGYGEFSNEIKNYINLNDEYKNSLISFIKQNYFESFQNLNLEFNKNNIFMDSSFKNNLLNVFESKSAKSFEDYTKSDQNSEKIFKTIFRNDPNSESTKQILKELYFTNNNMDKWNKELITLKSNYLKNLKLTDQQTNLIEKSNEYISADSIGNFKLKGATITIGSGINKYIHELPDFNLSVTYNASSKVEEKVDFLSEFTSKVIIKGMHNFYGIDSNFKYPEFNSDQDYLMNIGNKEIISNIKKKFSNEYQLKFPGTFSQVFWNIWSSVSYQKSKEFISNLNIFNMLSTNALGFVHFIFENHSKFLKDFSSSSNGTYYNNKVDPTINENDISLIPTKGGSKSNSPDLITFKLGYLAVNFKYEKLFNLSESQKSKIFIKFV
ncbi:hypothetical protein [Spiroplasma floricola]|uniref:Lipoprotein n=1 Tax=Spiroplasma floricola 23-6 TaxID=1336749 RepID=A0A2K8SES4_9MOLU|nr:hypothetical protein [Spiroplasma floricola]AUB31758.1 hypothetical protein SFLOR_v1c07100 [Spiroplasma floricola 23-6]